MITNPHAKTVLCYGDSNTHGTADNRVDRLPVNVRWTGVLQDILGHDYSVIEEGLGGRTTNLNHYNATKPSRNGLPYFKACIETHWPLDFIVIMLGTNYLKNVYDRPAVMVAKVLVEYVDCVRELAATRGTEPKIVLVSPILIDDRATRPNQDPQKSAIKDVYDAESVRKSHQLADAIEEIAKAHNCQFIDAAAVAEPGQDGLHMAPPSHAALAKAIAERIQ